MLNELLETIKNYFIELFTSYKAETQNDEVSKNSKTITKDGFYTTIHENLRNTGD